MRGQVYEGGIRMPAAVVWPGVVQAGRIIDTFVSTADIFPTVLAAANIELGAEHTIDGKDMGPILRGEPIAIDSTQCASRLRTQTGAV